MARHLGPSSVTRLSPGTSLTFGFPGLTATPSGRGRLSLVFWMRGVSSEWSSKVPGAPAPRLVRQGEMTHLSSPGWYVERQRNQLGPLWARR